MTRTLYDHNGREYQTEISDTPDLRVLQGGKIGLPPIKDKPPLRFSADNEEQLPKDLSEQIGKVGWNTRKQQGNVIWSEDFNPKMSPYVTRGLRTKHGLWKKMRQSDGNVAGVSLATELPILSAHWQIETKQDATDEEKQVRDFLYYCLEQINFSAFMAKVVRAEQYGFRLFEIVAEKRQTPWGVKWVPVALEDRLPWSVESWVMDESERVVGVVQKTVSNTFVIPSWKWMLFTHQSADVGPEGESAYRPGWSYWDAKQELEKTIRGITKKWSFGIAIARATQKEAMTGNLIQKIKEGLRDWVSTLHTYLVLPYGWEIELQFPVQNLPDLTPRYDWLDRQVLTSMVANWMLMGMVNTGTYNLMENHLKFFRNGRNQKAREYADVISYGNEYGVGLLSTFVEANFNVSKGFRQPWLSFTNIDTMDLKDQATVFQILANANAFGPLNRAVWNQNREMYGVAPLDSEPQTGVEGMPTTTDIGE